LKDTNEQHCFAEQLANNAIDTFLAYSNHRDNKHKGAHHDLLDLSHFDMTRGILKFLTTDEMHEQEGTKSRLIC
jgi:hypothetical protein